MKKDTILLKKRDKKNIKISLKENKIHIDSNFKKLNGSLSLNTFNVFHFFPEQMMIENEILLIL